MKIVTQTGAEVIGREAELAVLDDFMQQGAGRRALVLAGEPGIGKTTIVRAALSEAAAGGLRVFSARPTTGEMELPYVGLGDLLAGVEPDALAGLATPQSEAIEAALGRDGSSERVDRHALSRGVLELLRLEASEGDLLLAVDDVQWLDRPTAAALTFALRRIGSSPIRVLVAVRTEGDSLSAAPLGVADWENLGRLDIGPLSTTELGAVIRQRLGEQLPRPRLEAIRRASGGNPMFALELAQAPNGGAASATGLASALRERVRAIDPEAHVSISFAAASLRPSIDLLVRAGVTRPELKAALATGILEADGERLSFAHPLLGAAAYELLLPDERREIHARLATASADPVERGHHVSLSALAPDESAAEILDQAAGEAANLGDHAGAAVFFLRAAELSADPTAEAASAREVRAAKELYLGGDVSAAVALTRSLIERLPRGLLRAEARRLHAECSVGPGMSYEESLAELKLSGEDAEGEEGMQAELHLAMGEVCAGMCRLSAAVAHARQAIALAERAGATSTAVAALSELGFAECMLGLGVTEAARLANERWDGDSVHLSTYTPRMALACELLYTTAFDEAVELLAQELAMAEEQGVEVIAIMARGLSAEAQLRAGSWADALANARLALEHARQAGDAQVINGSSYMVAMAQALLGHHEEARSLATPALSEAEAIGDFWFRLYHRGVLGLIALAEEDPVASVYVLEPAWTLMLERELGDLSIFPVAHVLGEALVAVGRLEDAADVAENLAACPVGGKPWCRAMAGRITALIASARGDHDSARDSIATALQAHLELPEPFEHARTLQISGMVERRARNWGAARAAFVDALERFDALGAARWAEKAAAAIARLPGRRPADGKKLTTREREVAELVAAGLANKEVAARLFISLSTVEKTLSRAYAKLGVRSRAELAGRLQQQWNRLGPA